MRDAVIIRVMTKNKIILTELKELLTAGFGDDIGRVILFGSQVEGRARRYSDYDILVILNKDYGWRLEDAILDSCYEIDLKYDIVTDVKVISRNELNTMKGKQPFILNALEHGWVA